ncbi:MAG TPA: helix-turn-helix transcriptional regulator [Jatrophihabitantaceae bacterium]|jgi:DNA-binding PadR family transcriptional regulator|nr:helix-turn-helix transcriptional regulator [Jatrophihabitantaceae bacterium]
MRQEVVLALLAKEPAPGSQLRVRLEEALGPLGEGLNPGHIYVTLGRLEAAGLVSQERPASAAARQPTKSYALTPAGHERVMAWLHEVSWPKPDLTEFHLKLLAAARAGLADPISLIDAQRRALLRLMRESQRAVLEQPDDSDGALLLEGIVLRLQADLRWIELCERTWTSRRRSS